MKVEAIEVIGPDGLMTHFFHNNNYRYTIDRVENNIVYINRFDLNWDKEEVIKVVLGTGCIIIQREEEVWD